MHETLHVPTSIDALSVEPYYSLGADTEDDRERNSGYTKTISFTNSLSFGVTVTDRDGFSIAVKNNRHSTKTGYFIVYVRYNIPNTVKFNENSLLNVDDAELPAELRAIKLALQKELSRKSGNPSNPVNTIFQIAYKVNADCFKQNNGAFHLSQLGITLSAQSDKRRIINPDSSEGRRLSSVNVTAIPGLNYRIEINDPNHIYGHRFINSFNRVFKITPTVDKAKPEGVYLYTSTASIAGSDLSSYYKFEEAEPALLLFKTIEDAMILGDIKSERERTIDTLKHEQRIESLLKEKELKIESHQHSLSKLVIDKMGEIQQSQKQSMDTFFEMQRQLADEKEDDRKREHDLELRKQRDEFDRRSAERKDTTELIKWGAAVVTGFVTLGFTIIKIAK